MDYQVKQINIPTDLGGDISYFRFTREMKEFEHNLFLTNLGFMDESKKGTDKSIVFFTLYQTSPAKLIVGDDEITLNNFEYVKLNQDVNHSLILDSIHDKWGGIILEVPKHYMNFQISGLISSKIDKLKNRFEELKFLKLTYFSFYYNQVLVRRPGIKKRRFKVTMEFLDKVNAEYKEYALTLKKPYMKEILSVSEFLRLTRAGVAVNYGDLSLEKLVTMNWVKLTIQSTAPREMNKSDINLDESEESDIAA